ncbi:hypothetical protein JTE90_012504 [Oedothorax gibbosus]|uniref:Uncharacterized protein n=1 Tax=Oedothorax gibbosus TaxID=931172 RepID=A0AAV6UYF8_9ARAC|nr:hypothetical protein JTE90_012504 [Oedothorax gibbosus]
MKKVINSRRMYDMASERSITALSRAMESEKEQTIICNPEKITASYSKQDDSSKLSQEISPSKLLVQAGCEKMSEPVSTSKSTEQNMTSSLLEQVSASKSPERIRSKAAGVLCIYELVERPITRQSTKEEETFDNPPESKPEEECVKKLKNLQKDNPKLKLLKHINVGNLFAICYQHPEFHPLVTSMFQVHEFVSSSWSIHEQDLLIRICKDIEVILTEIVSLKYKPHSSHDIKDKFSRLSWCINEFIDILHLHMDTLHTEKLRVSRFYPPLKVESGSNKRKKPQFTNTPKTNLSNLKLTCPQQLVLNI